MARARVDRGAGVALDRRATARRGGRAAARSSGRPGCRRRSGRDVFVAHGATLVARRERVVRNRTALVSGSQSGLIRHGTTQTSEDAWHAGRATGTRRTASGACWTGTSRPAASRATSAPFASAAGARSTPAGGGDRARRPADARGYAVPHRLGDEADRRRAHAASCEDGVLALDDPVARWLPELASPRVLVAPDAPLDRTRAARRARSPSAHLLTCTAGWGACMEPTPLQAAMLERGVFPGPLPAHDDGRRVRRARRRAAARLPARRGWLYDTPHRRPRRAARRGRPARPLSDLSPSASPGRSV